MAVQLVPLVAGAGKAALTIGKGSLIRQIPRSFANGAAWSAGAEFVNQIAEWARSIGGTFDTTDQGPGGVDGCGQMEAGGYGQLQRSYGNDVWNNFGDTFFNDARVTSVSKGDVYQSYNGAWCCTVDVASVGDSSSLGYADCHSNKAQAEAVSYRIVPIVGQCEKEEQPPQEPVGPIDLPPMQAGDCTINVTFMGFMGNDDGSGNIEPVFRWTPQLEERASGGVITGECNFQPTITVGGGGDGKDPPRTYPEPDDDPGSDDWWKRIAQGLAAGVASAVANKIIESLLNRQEAASFTLVAPCDVDDDGNHLSYTVDFPAQSAQNRLLDWQLAQAYLLQQHLNWKTPTCGNESEPGSGDWRTISFISDHTSPYGKSRLHKRFRYRSTSGWTDSAIVDHWKDFVWESGPVIVKHLGASWGTPQVWASTADEGKRVIRHAAGEAGLDPDQVGRWSVGGSGSPRLGVSDTMRVTTKGGYYWITARDGSNARPLVAKVPEPGSGVDKI